MGSKAFGNVISDSPMTPRPPHLVPKAKNIIFLYMDGGVSHVDTFDPKPLLDKENGQPFKMKIEPTQFNNNGGVLKSPWEFNHYGQSGTPVSALFPHIASCVDDIAVIRSMVADFSEHTNANYFLHTGHGMQGRPSMGAWITYGLGSDNQDLPGFVVLNGGLIPPGGLDNFTSGFLPASYQGSVFKAGDVPLANIRPSEESASLQTNKLDFIRRMDTRLLGQIGHADQVESSIANYELAYRMQAAVPELTELSGESEATKRLYGLEAEFEHAHLRRTVSVSASLGRTRCPLY
jgi:hypothetical protein